MSNTIDRPGRCDRCGATAKFEVVLPTGQNLLLCGHHEKQHEAVLIERYPVMPIAERVTA